MIYGVRPWAVVVGLLMIAAAGLGVLFALRPPGPPEPCVESAEVYHDAFDEDCSPGAKVEIYSAGMHLDHAVTLVKCVCPRGKP